MDDLLESDAIGARRAEPLRPAPPRVAERVAVIGLGYVGLPVAVALARTAEHVVGYDTSTERIARLLSGRDPNGEVEEADLSRTKLTLSADPAVLAGASVYIVTVPTPLDAMLRPDLGAILAACDAIGPHLTGGAIVILESTVYPGVTEEICGPALERASGLTAGRDFFLGYSPERINPGDRVHRFETVTKVVSAQDPATLDRVARLYGSVVTAGVHRAPSIRVAEAAKVIENTQRDINIALMNELSIIFERLGIPTHEVLEAAATKWNFLDFRPGLVGGHCIGIDPYYLAARAQQAGLHPEIILAGRRINDGMGRFVAERAIRMLAAARIPLHRAQVGILGLTFKEEVPDLRNSRVPEVISVLADHGLVPVAHDPHCQPDDLWRHYHLRVTPLDSFPGLDALILAVPHRAYLSSIPRLNAMIRQGGLLLDLKAAVPRGAIRPDITVWSL